MTDPTNRLVAATATLLATIATVGAAAPLRAEAAPAVIASRAVVAYGDLDLTTASGRATMGRRIRHAAKSVCGPMDIADRDAVRDCRRDAIASAMARLAALPPALAGVRLAAAR